jgi:hypothetical protein
VGGVPYFSEHVYRRNWHRAEFLFDARPYAPHRSDALLCGKSTRGRGGSTGGACMTTDDKYLIAVCAIAAALMLLGII